MEGKLCLPPPNDFPAISPHHCFPQASPTFETIQVSEDQELASYVWKPVLGREVKVCSYTAPMLYVPLTSHASRFFRWCGPKFEAQLSRWRKTMPPIVQGQVFPTLLDFKNALRDWAIERNWTPHILDSDSHRVRAGCRSSPDCPFRVRANYSVKRGDAKVTTCDDNHTCEPFRTDSDLGKPHQDIKRAETGKLKFLLDAVPKLMLVTLDTNIQEIIDAVAQRYGQKIPLRQAQKVKSSLTDRVKGPCRHCHQLGHTRRHCPQLRDSAPRPMPFTQNSITHHSNGNDDHDDGTYADGGLDYETAEGGHSDLMDYANDNSSNNNASAFSLGHPQQLPNNMFAPSRQNGIPIDPKLASRIERLNSGEVPVPVQPAVAPQQTPTQLSATANHLPTNQNGQTSKTPQEARLEAAKLMQQAARLMQEAARLNSEAARLTASAAGD